MKTKASTTRRRRAAKDLQAKKNPKGGIIAVLIGLAKPKGPATREV